MGGNGPSRIGGESRLHADSPIDHIERSRINQVDKIARRSLAPETRTSKWGILRRHSRKIPSITSFVVGFMARAVWSNLTGRLTREEREAQGEMIEIYQQRGIKGLIGHLRTHDTPQIQKMAANFLKEARETLYQRLPAQEEAVAQAEKQLEAIALSPERLIGIESLADKLNRVEEEYQQLLAQCKQAQDLIDTKARIPNPTEERYANLQNIEEGKVTYWLGLRAQVLTTEEKNELEGMRAFKAMLPGQEDVWNTQLPDSKELEATIAISEEKLAMIDMIKESLYNSESELVNALTHSLLYGVEASDISINDYTEEQLISFAKQHAVRMPLSQQSINRIALGERVGSQLYRDIHSSRR